MKKGFKIVALLSLSLVFLWGNVLLVSASDTGMSYDNSFSLKDGQSISIDGDFSDWDGIPCSYEYNWDNSENCWVNGVWIDGEVYYTEPGTYSTDVRHMMQMYCDGDYIYIHIMYGRNYRSRLNGDDFRLYIGDEVASYQVVGEDGSDIATMLNVAPGLYPVEIRHRDSKLSFLNAEGTNGYLSIKEDNINNELEIRVPLEELQRQNPNINLETISTIEFFTPNLMYRRISAVGTSSAPVVLASLCGGIVLCSLLLQKRRKHGNV